MSRVRDTLKRIFSKDDGPPPELDAALAELRTKTPAPVFWLLGKTQSGKTSIIRYLTGADDATIGSGFRPCTRTSRQFQFPSAEAPLLSFLDTRGVDEPGYDPAEDIAAFDAQAHVVVVTAKVTDFAQGNIRAALEPIRRASPSRPVVLCVTCLNEAIPREPHPTPYPFTPSANGKPESSIPDALARRIEEHKQAFAGLFDVCVPIDLTKPEDGFPDPNYGGDALKQTLLDVLPKAYRQTLLRLKDATERLKDVHLQHAMPLVVGYSTMAASAGAVPVPFLDLALLPGIQAKMARSLAQVYGQTMTAEKYGELLAAVGVGLLARQAVRELTKFIPYVGSVVGAASAWATTFALGRALCYYFQAVCEGHVPDAKTLRKYYQEQYAAAETKWKNKGEPRP